MKLTIAICDDEPIQVDTLVSYLKSYKTNYKVEIIRAFRGKELISKIKKRKIDIAFLDIEMNGIDGIELGKEIRDENSDCIIVYITGFKDYALEAFHVRAFNYIIKPITEKKFKESMKDIILRFEEKSLFNQRNNTFTITTKNNVVKINYEEILYFEKILNKIKVYTTRNEYEYYGTIKGLKKELDMERNFIQCHQGYIVNRLKIFELSDEQIHMRGIEKFIPVSRRNKLEVRKILENNLFA